MSEKAAEKLSFEEALGDLEAIVRELESGQGDLEKSITDYERGMKLKEQCMKRLADAKLKVEKIMQTQSGKVVTEPFDGENANV